MNVRVMNRIFCTLLIGAVVQTAAAQLELTWHTIDGGGKISSTGGGFQLTGGFWFEQPPGDCNATGIADLLDHADFAAIETGGTE